MNPSNNQPKTTKPNYSISNSLIPPLTPIPSLIPSLIPITKPSIPIPSLIPLNPFKKRRTQ